VVDDFTYNFQIARLIPKENFLSGSEYTMNISKQEFIDDINSQIPKSLEAASPNHLDGELEAVAFESLFTVVQRHINKFGRILPTDLDTYIGQNILLFNAILQAQGKQMLDTGKQEERFSKFNYLILGILPDDLKVAYSSNA